MFANRRGGGSFESSRSGKSSRGKLSALLHKIVLAAVALLWIALLASLLGRVAWPLDLFAHFRVQYAVLFVMVALAALLLRRFASAVIAALGLALSVVPLVPYLAGSQQAAVVADGTMFRLVSFNVWFRNPDMARTAAYLERSAADAVVLLELTPAQAEILRPLLPGYPHYYIEPSRMGAAVFSKWPLLSSQSMPLAPEGAIAAHVQLDWRGIPVTILGVHLNWPLGPRNSAYRNEELRGLAAFARAQQGPLLVAGDFNLTPWSEYFSDALDVSGMHDAGRGFGLARSWPAQFAPAGMRIDHCWLSSQWRSRAVSIGPDLGSDHLPLLVDVSLQP